MSLYFTNEWFIFHQKIDKITCNKIKKLGKGKWEESSVDTSKETTDEERITGKKGDYKLDKKIRISDVFWTTEQWVYDLTFPYMLQANKRAGWNLDIKAAESMQLTRYRKGGFYSFHKDGRADHLSAYDTPDNHFLHGNVRKISMSIILNDNFEGGAFEVASYEEQKCSIIPIEAKAGDIIFFTSGVEHRVAPVTKGVRYSLVNWFVGPPVR
jgi:PKHD-type hydroxylase